VSSENSTIFAIFGGNFRKTFDITRLKKKKTLASGRNKMQPDYFFQKKKKKGSIPVGHVLELSLKLWTPNGQSVSFWTNILERLNREWNPWSQHGLAPQRQGYKESSELDPRMSAHTQTLSLLSFPFLIVSNSRSCHKKNLCVDSIILLGLKTIHSAIAVF
jgi:hypothetical protein